MMFPSFWSTPRENELKGCFVPALRVPFWGNTSPERCLEPSILPVDQAAGMGIGITFRVKHSARDFTV